uniref:RRM domain-containing protein n=1 Tax=Wuchereria bancrofti TaxID=6293 RepID=A0A1I8EQQ4_WUCBA
MMSQWFCSRSMSRFELPTGEKKLQLKAAGFNGADCLTSESLIFLIEMKIQKGETIAEEKARAIFVGNALLSSTRKGIKELFSQFGTVEIFAQKENKIAEQQFLSVIYLMRYPKTSSLHILKRQNVSFVRIVREPKTGNSKGFAFMAFKESAVVPLALHLVDRSSKAIHYVSKECRRKAR